MFEPSIPYTTQAKQYGDAGEDEFVDAIRSLLPDCNIKKNIIIQTAEGNAEIDCLILYQNKLFAIEVKRWKGHLVEQNGSFIQYKKDRWTSETHMKVHKSPFKQVERAAYLLKKQMRRNVWINTIVFFEESHQIDTTSENIWFNNINELVSYIIFHGKASQENNALDFFNKCTAADYLYSNFGNKSLQCVVCDNSLRFKTSKGTLDKNSIHSISIKHRWSYDYIKITSQNGAHYITSMENGHIYVIHNGHKYRYALCKLDYILISS